MAQVEDVFVPFHHGVKIPLGPRAFPLPTQSGSADQAHRSITEYNPGFVPGHDAVRNATPELDGLGAADETFMDKVLPPIVAGLTVALLVEQLRKRKRR